MRQPPTSLMNAYYHPIEAAIRWSDLHRFEASILAKLGHRVRPTQDDFPRWPKLYLNSERIYCALYNRDLPFGQHGILCQDLSLLDDPDLSICDAHLKAWMKRYYPEQKPKFLFSPLERRQLSSLANHKLLEENSLLVTNLNEHAKQCRQLKAHNASLVQRIQKLELQVASFEVPSERSVITFRHIIGGLLTLLRGSSPGGQRYSLFDSDTAIIDTMLSFHSGRLGISERTLQKHFSAARKSLDT